ncbi:sulfate permease [Rhypophila decipiens]
MAADMSSRAKGFLTKALGIKLQEGEPNDDHVIHGHMQSIRNSDCFVEQEPQTAEFLLGLIPEGPQIWQYLVSLFPFISWIGHYNLQWLMGDLVAGITIGAVVVPQGMAYAKIANLPVQFGLYSSFMGVLVYWFFATSKDITIGPVAVMCQLTGGIVSDMENVLPDVPGHVIASALSILAGSIVLFVGLIRCGWIVDMISLPALSAFMTGSAITIAIGQVPTMMGISGVSTRDAPYLVLIHTLQGLPKTSLDAAMGLSALFLLYTIRAFCGFAAGRWPKHQRVFFFLSTLRTVFIILLYTLVSWLVNRGLPAGQEKFKIVLDVPAGFQNAGVPVLNKRIAGELVGYLPATVIVLLIEHIAISKSFGRVNNYSINPSQEMVAIGVTNVLGPFVGGFASTGSFSRTAIKSKAGVRTPFAGVITALVVLLALYALPAVFYFIPNASLAAVIIHAVGDLITTPNTIYQFWRVSPFEVFIFFAGVITTVFSTIENGIYCTVCLSAAMLLYRILKGKGRFLGHIEVKSMLDNNVVGEPPRRTAEYGTFTGHRYAAYRNVFLPITHADGSNPVVDLDTPYPGIFIYRFSEGFNYPNASNSLQYMVDHIFARTRRTNLATFDRPGDRPWNNPGPSRRQLKAAATAGVAPGEIGVNTDLPTLKAIILDFSSVNHVDITSVQQLIDVRNQLDRYTAPDIVHWHIACIHNRWTKRALVAAGFGSPASHCDGLQHRWRSIFSVAEIGGSQSAAAAAEKEANEKEANRRSTLASLDVETSPRRGGSSGGSADRKSSISRNVAIHGTNRPLFHVDLTSALQSAIANVEASAEFRAGSDEVLQPPSLPGSVKPSSSTSTLGNTLGQTPINKR